MNCIEAKNIYYRFKNRQTILNDLNITVPDGSIYGFLGSNGAGKTTTIKLLLGLLKQQHGSIHIFGKPFKANRLGILRETGSLIEMPSLYAHLSCYENLALWQQLYRCDKSNVGRVLGLAGLSHAGNKKAGELSLGMKQRLGIAIALLHRPKLLILDEPINGLDPNGIIEIRELLLNLNEEYGTTIVISSHLLPELERIVTHLGIINNGSMVFEGAINELYACREKAATISFEINDPERGLTLMQRSGIPATISEGNILLDTGSHENVAAVNPASTSSTNLCG